MRSTRAQRLSVQRTRKKRVRGVVVAVIAGLALPLALLMPTAARSPGSGVFHTVCAYHHSAPNDPIVHPNRPGASHEHDFFGNVSTDAYSTLASLSASTGNCLVHAPDVHADRSGYWVPQLIFDGYPISFVEAQAYYETNARQVNTPPPGLEIIGGNAHATAPQSTNVVKFTCSGNVGVPGQTTPPVCPRGSLLKIVVKTPDCLADHIFHAAKGVNATPFSTYAFLHGGSCPAGYVPLPTVRIEVKYPAGVDGRGIVKFASGSVNTMHADWFNAWNPTVLDKFVQGCLNTGTDCGNTVPK